MLTRDHFWPGRVLYLALAGDDGQEINAGKYQGLIVSYNRLMVPAIAWQPSIDGEHMINVRSLQFDLAHAEILKLASVLVFDRKVGGDPLLKTELVHKVTRASFDGATYFHAGALHLLLHADEQNQHEPLSGTAVSPELVEKPPVVEFGNPGLGINRSSGSLVILLLQLEQQSERASILADAARELGIPLDEFVREYDAK